MTKLDNTYTVVAKPLITYGSDNFGRTSFVMDVWNESFEQPLTSTNHYWYGGALTQTSQSTGLNNTLDGGFEEVQSDGLNGNVSIPQWFSYVDNSNLSVRLVLDRTIKNDSATSVSVETRFINTTNTFTWKTPVSVHSSCGYTNNPPSNTIDGSTSTRWDHKVAHRHYVIYDLGAEYLNKIVKVYSGTDGRINDVYVYVSSNPSDMGSAVVSGWSPSSSGWASSPEFLKKGRYIKLDFWTSTGGELWGDIFDEFQVYTATPPSFHAYAGTRTISDYFVKTSDVLLSDNPLFSLSLFLDYATPGDGFVEAYYALADIEITKASTTYHIIYVVPSTAIGSPSATHFTNTTYTKYLYGVVTLNQFDVWKKYTRNVKSDYENLWGSSTNATLKSLTLKGGFYQPMATSTSNPPAIRINYDPVSLKLVQQSNQEQLVNGGFESQGWSKVQNNKLQSSSCSKVSTDSAQGTTSYLMNITGDTSGGSGTGFSATKHQAVGLGSSAFIRESNDSTPFKLRAFIKVVDSSNVATTVYSYVGLRVTFQNKSAPYNTYRLFYVIMVKGSAPSSTSNEKYVQLVAADQLQKGVWYEIARSPVTDSGWNNVKVTEIAMVIAFYYGENYSSTSNARIAARFDYFRLIKEAPTTTTYVNNLQRSSAYKRHGSWSLKLNATSSATGFARYETGAENGNNSYYIAFPRNMNFSVYFYAPSAPGSVTVQVSLAIDDGPTYGDGYIYELMYYYGSQAGVGTIFFENIPTHSIMVSPTVPTGSWVHAVLNWTKDMPGSWTAVSPRVEAVGLKVWTNQGTVVNVYFDLAAIYGRWWGVKKTLQVASDSEISILKLNVSDFWYIYGNATDPGSISPPDNNASNVDGSAGVGSHSNFNNLKYGPDSSYDILSEGLYTGDARQINHYVDNNSSNVDSRAGMGYHSNFTAAKYGPDGTSDELSEQWMGPHVEINDYVDSNTSNVDNLAGTGSHSNFTALQYGPDSQLDTLTEGNIYPPPNDVTDFVDNNSSDIDGGGGVGGHSDFPAMQTGPDGVFDTLTEGNAAPPPVDYNHFASDNTTDVDSDGNTGSHSNFNNMKNGPDSIFDTLTENDTAPKVDINDFVDNNSSNVDDFAGYGTHSDFNAMKAGPDSVIDTLTEYNVAGGSFGWTRPTSVHSSCGGTASDTIDGSLTTDWRHLVTETHWVIYDMGSSVNITKVRVYTQQNTMTGVRVSVSNSTTFDDSSVVVTNWTPPIGGWNDSPEFNKKGRYIRLDNITNTQSSGQMKLCFYEFEAWTVSNFRFDREVQFTGVLTTTTYADLCIYVINATSEDLSIDYWDGNAWVNLFSDIFIGWNNVSVKNYLTSSTFTLRFRDGTPTGDGVQDSWKIDAVLLHTWTPPKYQLDLEVRISDIVYTTTNAELCIYAGTLGGDDLKVDIWDGAGWVNVFSQIQQGWNNASVKDYVTGPYVTIRFRDGGLTDSTAKESWQVDVALIHAWTPLTYNYQLDREVQFTDADYSEFYEELCIRTGALDSEKISVQVRAGGSWITVMNLTSNSWNNVSVSDYLQSSTFTIRFVDANHSDGTVIDSWQIDAVVLHTWTPNQVDYRLNMELQFTSINYTQENKVLAIYVSNIGNETIAVDRWVSGSWVTLITSLSQGWNNATVSDYITSSTFTIRLRDIAGQNDTHQNSWQLDAALLHLWTIGGYKLNLEEQFTNVEYNEDNITLALYPRTMGEEALRVDIWYRGAWYNLIQSLSANQWANISINDYVSSSTVTLRFRDANQNDDPGLDSWQLDAVLLRIVTGNRYKLDLEAQFTNVNFFGHSGEICVKTGSVGNENLLLDYWNGQSWVNLIQGLQGSSWNNMSVPLTSENLTVRFRDGLWIRDKTQNTWQIDSLYLHLWQTAVSNPTIERSNATSANQWYYKWWGLRKITVVNETGSYEISGNSTNEGMLSYHDGDWDIEDQNALSDYEGYVKFNVTDFLLTHFGRDLEYQNYVQVEYVILFAQPMGFFQFASDSTATAANDKNKYDGTEYWHLDTDAGRNFEESSASKVLGF